jgi:cytochrome c peroxidase
MVARGRALFHDAKVGCDSCHDPERGFTDGEAHDVESLSAEERSELRSTAPDLPATAGNFDTPSQRHVGLTSPYFHDGSAPTLEALIERNHDRMGTTSHLSAEDRQALVTFLETL